MNGFLKVTSEEEVEVERTLELDSKSLSASPLLPLTREISGVGDTVTLGVRVGVFVANGVGVLVGVKVGVGVFVGVDVGIFVAVGDGVVTEVGVEVGVGSGVGLITEMSTLSEV